MALGACSMNKEATTMLDLPITEIPLTDNLQHTYTAYDVHDMLGCHQKRLFCQLQIVSRISGSCTKILTVSLHLIYPQWCTFEEDWHDSGRLVQDAF